MNQDALGVSPLATAPWRAYSVPGVFDFIDFYVLMY